MYNSYFGFSRSPFENNLDERFFFLSNNHQEILSTLLYSAETKNGFAIVYGDVGTGKSMLINSFLDKLPESFQPIIVLNPYVGSLDILKHIAKALKIRITINENVLELTDKVKKALTSVKYRQQSFVLIIDEAHLLPDQTLKEIGLLANIETPEQKLLQILLVGQNELRHKLNRPEMRHLHRRINVKRFLSPLNREETIQYVDYRLRQAGSSLASVFEDKCRRLIFKMTEGYPRLINRLCDNALLICMTEGLRKVNRKVLKEAHQAWQTDMVFTPKSSKAQTYRLKKPNKSRIVVAGSVAVVVLLGIIVTRSGFSVDNFKSAFQPIRSAIQTASRPQKPLVVQSEGLRKPEIASPRLRQSGETERAPASSLGPLASAPASSPLPAGFGRTEIAGALSSGEKQSSSPPRKSQMKPEASGEPKPVAEISTKKEALGPQEALNEVGRGPAPSPGSSPARVPSASTELIIKAGDNLSHIVNRNYPDNKKLGLIALILANPELTNENKILPGQAIYLPEINSDRRTIRLRDNLFYAIYGQYLTSESLKKDTSWLEKQKVHFILKDTKDSKRNVVYRVFLGGYATEAELEKALESVSLRSDKGYKGIDQANQAAGSMKNRANLVPPAVTDKQTAVAKAEVTQIHINNELRNDPVTFKFNDRIDGAFNKFAVVGQANQAAGFADNQKNVRAFNTNGGLVALSEVQLEQVSGENHVFLYKVDSNGKIDKSFNGFIGVGQANQSTGSINNQGNVFSFAGTGTK